MNHMDWLLVVGDFSAMNSGAESGTKIGRCAGGLSLLRAIGCRSNWTTSWEESTQHRGLLWRKAD